MSSALARISATALVVLGLYTSAWAGNQHEERLADAVRLALSRSITDEAPLVPKFVNFDDRITYLRWMGEMSDRLQRRMPDRDTRLDFLESVWYEARRAGLDPALVLGLIQVESAYRKYAVSIAGARGYMQVMPFWAKLVGNGDASRLFDMRANLRYGCSILRMYLDQEKGNLFFALGRYNGSRGRSEYPNAVLAAWRRWQYTPEDQPSYRVALEEVRALPRP